MMKGYIYQTEAEAIEARAKAADYKELPKPNGETLYWVNFKYSEIYGFYYIRYVEGLELVLGVPIEFEVTKIEIDPPDTI
tara:strand:+ start:44 stop:283 length:240 start_codon:yes stop_codon:yes gene_type:complete